MTTRFPPALRAEPRVTTGEQATQQLAIDATYAVAMCAALALALNGVVSSALGWARARKHTSSGHAAELAWSLVPLAFLIGLTLLAPIAPMANG